MAAARCLARSEFGSVSLQQIAAEVRFTAPALYAYFSTADAVAVLAGVEILYWTGLPRQQLDLPDSEAYARR